MTLAAATELAAATNENLANVSNTLIYSSMAVYTLAFFAYIAEWLFGSRSKVGRTAAALTTDEAGTKAGARSGPAVTVKKAGGTAVLERPAVVVRSATGTRDVPDGPGAHGGTEKGDLYGRVAISLTVLAFAIEAGGVLTRALSVERAPWGNMYEFNITFTTVAVGVYLALLALKKNVRWLGLPLTTTVLLDLGLAVTVLYTASDQLVPALHSYWLYIHVSTAIFCGAVFYVGAVATILYLFKDSFENKLASGGTPGRFASSVLDRLPAAASLDKFAYRVNAAVFPLWTFTIIAGAIWAGDAWGRYWGWDPKETWSFITWVAYAGYLHARATAGWKGRKAAYLALIAFACWLFNYYGVNIFVSGKHSYADVGLGALQSVGF
ncbi:MULTISPECIES: c-type cytochrome biogenesis protein CcsB [Streptomyces]|uniref:C-type cytochrome biogenesis protein CcsB n=1 Tax=Streptomyces tendae TaxID=1932 RepID=A0A6B3QKH7_STRTE|nr:MULTISPECIES: c-type cytochrome biogenesis protein CcsB [unclassified Streptomyces]MZG15285.1 c-type cytochrome biogenesis protein CcsB [Streptomyces sp. SID5914]NEV88606.1 c-type cytochrome biogenesis protein CcsB [Streptomyces tendae]BET48455.1 c-type cytochrome biogenesis protein CcsB [Kitasatospora aureofaciens]MBQ0966209.1 c-type cytochrome biogenesis protein CcsB [Streptomyces sp. RK74B]MBQ1006050.1 c-type cytochrome biogenesis protein CcsB [Streptomyces sp. RK23]